MFSKVYEVDCFQKEFHDMANEKLVLTPPFPRYQHWLIKSLTILEEYGSSAIKFKNFEKLEDIEPKLYSIRYPKSKLNPRVLFYCINNDEILLLVAFKEKSKSDYVKNTKLAISRLKNLNN